MLRALLVNCDLCQRSRKRIDHSHLGALSGLQRCPCLRVPCRRASSRRAFRHPPRSRLPARRGWTGFEHNGFRVIARKDGARAIMLRVIGPVYYISLILLGSTVAQTQYAPTSVVGGGTILAQRTDQTGKTIGTPKSQENDSMSPEDFLRPALPPEPQEQQEQQEQQEGGTTPKAVLYEENPSDPNGTRFVGSVIWHTEHLGAGQPPELAIRADIEVPERKLNIIWSLRRITDRSLPASHAVEILLKLPPDGKSGGIAKISGILMKQTEEARGVPLAALSVKVTSGFFLIGLSTVEAEKKRNIELLRDRPWLDVPIRYTNNRRAILAMEKGNLGERAFAEAFKAWELQDHASPTTDK
jgi:hypothetical protein